MAKYLAESEHYKVLSEFETVTLHFKDSSSRQPICIGHFYGDPECALISGDEKYVAMAGCGLIIYYLQEPFENYWSTDTSKQYIDLFTNPPNPWWTNGLHQTDVDDDWKYFRFVAANEDGEHIYKMNSITCKVEKIN